MFPIWQVDLKSGFKKSRTDLKRGQGREGGGMKRRNLTSVQETKVFYLLCRVCKNNLLSHHLKKLLIFLPFFFFPAATV